MAQTWRCGHPKDLEHSKVQYGRLRRCKICANAKRNARRKTAEGQARLRRYCQSPGGKAARARYRQSPGGKAARARYRQSPGGKAAKARFEGSVKGQLRRQARITFRGREIWFKKNPRTGFCAGCGVHYLQTPRKAQHALHHMIYDPDNPAAFTVELCRRCHAIVHRSPWTKAVLIAFA